jgi:hypothetical protein
MNRPYKIVAEMVWITVTLGRYKTLKEAEKALDLYKKRYDSARIVEGNTK